MSDLAEFLLARIAEDEALARAASIGSEAWRLDELSETVCWWPPERESVIEFERSHGLPMSDHWRGQTIDAGGDQIAPHIARWDPARVLAECDAKRRIVGLHRDESGNCELCCHWSSDGYDPIAVPWPCETLKFLALPYADHPEYRAEWRP